MVAEATGDTERFDQVLREYRKAPAITRERLYIDTMESVLGNTAKVLMDTEGGGNLLYLPLDQLLKGSGNTAEGSGAESGSRRVAPTDSDRSRRSSRQRETR